MSDLILSVSPNFIFRILLGHYFDDIILLGHYFDDIIADIKCQYTDVYDQGVIVCS